MTISQRQIFLHALEGLLKPVARFCLRRSLKLQEFTETAKTVFLQVAAEEIEREGAPVSTSKLSVITGLHRRDVMRLFKKQETKLTSDTSIVSRVIGQWQNDSRFSKAGKPRALKFEGKNSEFMELVRSVSKDLNPYTVLFELERIGAVSKDNDNDIVTLESKVYVPSGDIKESLSLLASDSADLVEAVEENIFKPQPMPNLHIKTQYDNICPEFIPEIRAWFLERGEIFHEEARKFLSKFDKDLNPKFAAKAGKARAAVGTFSVVDVTELAEEEED